MDCTRPENPASYRQAARAPQCPCELCAAMDGTPATQEEVTNPALIREENRLKEMDIES